jgi:hypothetical protein
MKHLPEQLSSALASDTKWVSALRDALDAQQGFFFKSRWIPKLSTGSDSLCHQKSVQGSVLIKQFPSAAINAGSDDCFTTLQDLQLFPDGADVSKLILSCDKSSCSGIDYDAE